MAVILIDCRQIGHALRCARKSASLNITATAKMLGVSRRDLLRYETGRLTVPECTLHRLMHFGLLVMRARQMTNTKK